MLMIIVNLVLIIIAIWLVILGKIGIVIYGILGTFISIFLIGIVMLPSIFLNNIYEKSFYGLSRFLRLLLPFLSSMWTHTVIYLWCCLVFLFCLMQTDSNNAIPLMIWAFVIAVDPLLIMTAKDQSDSSSQLSFIAFIGCLVMLLIFLIFNTPAIIPFSVFAGIMLLGAIFHWMWAYRELHKDTATMIIERMIKEAQ